MKFILVFLFSTLSNYLFGQNQIELLLNNEIEILERTFNDKIFLEYCSKGCDTRHLYEITNNDTIHIMLVDKKGNPIITSVDIIHIQIKLKEQIINLKNYNINTVFNFYCLKSGSELYRLFGFYNTDINLFYEKTGIIGIKLLKEEFVRNKILNKKESRYFFAAIKKEASEYPLNLNKPCALMAPYFKTCELKKANTIILPLSPLKSFFLE